MSKLKLLLITVVSFFTIPEAARACSCAYIATFCETITFGNDTIHSNYIIIHASVEEKFASGMNVEVRTIFFGQPESSMLAIVNGNGADCRKSTDQFTIGDQHIFVLYGESPDGYILSECGRTVLDVIGGEIIGPIAPGIDRLPLNQLHQIEGCGNLGSIFNDITVLPTLASQHIAIETTSDPFKVDIAMYDMAGRLVYEPSQNEISSTNPISIPVTPFDAGCYTIVVYAGDIRKVFRVVIMN